MENKKRTISLRIIVAMVICVSIFLISVLNMYQAYSGMKKGVLSATEITAQHLAESVNQTITGMLMPPSVTLHLLTHEKITRSGTMEDRLVSIPIFVEVLKTNPICSSVFIGYESGDFFLLRRFSHSNPFVTSPAPKETRYLVQTVTIQENGAPLGVLYFYDESLKMLERRVVANYQFDPRMRPWFKLAMHSDGIKITPPYVFFSTKDIGVTVAIRTARGDAVIAMDVTVNDLSRLLASLRITPASEIAIVDQTNHVVAYPDQGRLFVNEKNHSRLSSLEELGIPVFDYLVSNNISKDVLISFNDSNKDWYGLIAPVSDFASSNFKILIAIPSRELLEGVWDHLIQQGFIAVGITGILLLLGWWLGTQLVAPLQKLTTQVHALSDFNFDTSIGVATRVEEVRELGFVLRRMAKTISSFQRLFLTLNKEQNLEQMLMSVLQQLLNIVQLETGAIYLCDANESVLRLAVSQGENSVPVIPISSVGVTDEELVHEIQSHSGQSDILNILRNRGGDVVGVLIISCDDAECALMHNTLTRFLDRIAGSAAVAIETRQLILAQKELLNSIIQLIADAIDTKSWYTGGHCKRVPILATMLMEQILKSEDVPFTDYSMTDMQKEEFRIAAWLHDCGKITTPEYVVDKATKLEIIYNRIHEVRMRFEVLHRDVSIACLESIINGMDVKKARQICKEQHEQLQEDFAFIANCNIGGEFMASEDIERLNHIAQGTWMRYFNDRLGLSRDELTRLNGIPENESFPVTEQLLADKESHIVHWGDRIPPVQAGDPHNTWGFDMELPPFMYNYGEVYNLSLKKGTLTSEERFKINDHIVQTICMLSSLKLPKGLNSVPDIAGNHHEQMNGQGYPRKLTGKEMTIPERVMAVADIFEALTASDRPYKEGKTLTQSLSILSRMAKEGHIDTDIFNLFLRSGIYLEYAKQYLSPKQMDEIAIEDYLI